MQHHNTAAPFYVGSVVRNQLHSVSEPEGNKLNGIEYDLYECWSAVTLSVWAQVRRWDGGWAVSLGFNEERTDAHRHLHQHQDPAWCFFFLMQVDRNKDERE